MPRPRGLAKTGGRLRKNHELVEKLEELGCDPIVGLARIALAPETAPELKVRCYAELAQYVHAKRKAVEQTSEGKQEINITVERIGG